MDDSISQILDEGEKVPESEPHKPKIQKATKGEHFYTRFQEQINDYLSKNFSSCAKLFVSHVNQAFSFINLQMHANRLIFRILLSILDDQIREKNPKVHEPILREVNLFSS